MTLLKNLSATVEENPNFRENVIGSAIHYEPKRGFICEAQLGLAGLVMRCQTRKVAIPLDELFALAQKYEAGFVPPEGEAVDPTKKP